MRLARFDDLIEGRPMSQFRIARLGLLLAAIGLNAAPALVGTAHAQSKASASAAAEAPKETVRPEVYKQLEEKVIAELLAAKKYDEVMTRVKASRAVEKLTPFDHFIIDNTERRVAIAKNDIKEIVRLNDVMVASGRLAQSDKQNVLLVQASLYYNDLKDYPKAIEYAKKFEAEGGDVSKSKALLIRAMYLTNDNAGARAELEKIIADAEKAGKKPDHEDIKLLFSTNAKLKDMDRYLAAKEIEVRHYPSDEVWADLISRVMNKKTFNIKYIIDVLRLERAAVAVLPPEHYHELGELAYLNGSYTESKQVMDEGFAKGQLGTGSQGAAQKQLRDKATKSAAEDAKTIAAGEASALKSKDGTGLVNVGQVYASMGQYDKAADLIQKGIAKGGLKLPVDQAKLRLGAALAQGGKKDEAIKVFQSITATDGASDIAKYWVMWLNRANAAAVAAAK
jgi:tetratricopeptide (TPR) repeat protein